MLTGGEAGDILNPAMDRPEVRENLHAIRMDELRHMVAALKTKRDFCTAALRELPRVTVPEPAGAFYLFPKIDGLTDSAAFCRQLLLEERVGLAPGSAFGAGGEGSVRICYAADRTVLEPALERFGRFLAATRL